VSDPATLTALVCQAFSDALEQEVSPDEDFFALGGDSLSGMFAVCLLQERLGVEVDASAPFLFPTARTLADALRSGSLTPEQRPWTTMIGGAGPVSPVQQGQLLIAPHIASRGFLSWVYQLNGHLDVAALAAAFDDVVRDHPILRTRFTRDGEVLTHAQDAFSAGGLRVVLADDAPKAEAIEAAVAAAQRTLDELTPVRDSKLRATLYAVAPKTHVLAVFVAEALIDAESGALLATELSNRYAARTGRPAVPGDVPNRDSFIDHVRTTAPAADTVDRLCAHWTEQVAAGPPRLGWPLPTRAESAFHTFRMTPGEWTDVTAVARSLRTTPYVVVLSGYQAAIAAVTGLTDLLVTSVVSDRSAPQTRRMLGSFHSVVRVAARHVPGEPFAELAARTTAAVRTAVAHSAVPAPYADAAGTGRANGHPDGVHFYLLDRHEGPRLPGVRKRRFRLHDMSREALRLRCTSDNDGSEVFVFASTTLVEPTLAELAAALRDTLLGARAAVSV
jgi:acyl carrier protein